MIARARTPGAPHRAKPPKLTSMTLYIGTSGWAYREWRPGFYPLGLPRRRWLEHYSTRLNACEINATFYRLQSPATFERWLSSTPDSFRFVTKAHRRLTHSRQTTRDGRQTGFLDRFSSSVSVLGQQLGAILFQFPPSKHHDGGALRQLLETLPRKTPCAFEFRHPSWDSDAVREEIADAGGTVCVSDSTGEPPERLPPGPIAYVRLRFDKYSHPARVRWRDLLLREARGRDVYAFCKHEGVPAGDEHAGVGLAEWLIGNA